MIYQLQEVRKEITYLEQLQNLDDIDKKIEEINFELKEEFAAFAEQVREF
jgi:hypothetical protein